MSQMRARSSRVSRDVKMVFDLYVETLEGGTPGQQYTAHYQRGVNEKKASEPITADREGNVNFMWHSTFTSTLQRKNDNCYKQKDLRLWVREHPSGFMVTETWYDLAASVDNEVFPNKKLKVKSATGKQSVLFSMSGITEEEYVRFTSDKSRGTSRARSVVSAAYNDPAQDEDPDTHDDDRQRNTSVVSASRAKSTQSRQQNIQEDDDDVDLDNLVDGAVAKASGRRPATDSALPTPKVQQQQLQQPQKQPQHQPQQQQQQQQQPQQRSESPAPRDAAPPPSIQPKTVSTTAPPAERPPPATVSQQRRDAPLPPPASQSQPHRSESPVAAIPSRHTTAPPPPPSDYDERSSALPTPQQSVVVQPSEAHRVSPVYDDLTHQRSVSAASATFSQPLTRSEKEVEKYLSEITAAVLAMSSDGSRSDTSAPASVSTGVHTFSIVGGAKTSSSIPRATLLALHCIMHWTGAKRIAFLHDFIAMLMVDVVPHTRHAPQWMNTLLHILFYTMTQMDDNTEDAYDFLSEEEAVHLTDEFMQCILNAEESGFGSRNTFVVRGSRNDRLHQLFSYDDRGDNEANQRALSPAALILFNLGLDESLRRLAAAATSPAMADIERFCFPPPAPPTRHSINGYHYDSTNSYGVGGGGPDHAAEDAAFSVVLHALNRLYFNILGVNKDNINSATALLKLTGAEVFKIIFRNINNTLLNHVITKDRSGRPTCRIRTVDDAMNFKLALSMLESWLQEHHMYISARSELLACRQLCDLVILHKPLLKNMDLSDEVTSALSPQLVVFVLEQYEPSAHTDDADAVPKDILDSFRKAADDSNRLAAKKSKHASTDIVPRLPIRSLMTFPFLDFISSFFQADDPTGRKSMRMSVMASRAQQSSFGDQPVTASAQRALDWDYRPDRLTELRNRESFLGVSTTHDAAGRELSVKASRDAQTNLSLKVLALSVADDDTIRRTVV